jgi:hypothetical protein
VTTAVARRCRTSSFCAIISLLLGPQEATYVSALGWLGSRSLMTPQREHLTGPQVSAILCSRRSNEVPVADVGADADPRTGVQGLDEMDSAAAQIQVQGARYPEHIQRLSTADRASGLHALTLCVGI